VADEQDIRKMGGFQIVKYTILIPGLIFFICFFLFMWLDIIIGFICKKWNLDPNSAYFLLCLVVFFISLYWFIVVNLFFSYAPIMGKAKTLVIVFSLTFLGSLVLLLQMVCIYYYSGTFYYFSLQYYCFIIFNGSLIMFFGIFL